MKNKTTIILSTALLLACCFKVQATVVIYQHSFGGANGDVLLGTAPDTRPGSEVWSGSSGSFDADGSVDGEGPHGVWLPLAPESNKVYTISSEIDLTSVAGGISFGFAVNNANDDFATFDTHSYGSGVLTVDFANFYTGEGLTGETYHDPIAGTNLFSIVLDTTDPDSANWTVAFTLNGSNVVSASTVTDSTSWPGAANFDQIQYVGFSSYGGGTGTIANFTVEAVPEPTVIMLIGLSSGGLLLIKRLFC